MLDSRSGLIELRVEVEDLNTLRVNSGGTLSTGPSFPLRLKCRDPTLTLEMEMEMQMEMSQSAFFLLSSAD